MQELTISQLHEQYYLTKLYKIDEIAKITSCKKIANRAELYGYLKTGISVCIFAYDESIEIIYDGDNDISIYNVKLFAFSTINVHNILLQISKQFERLLSISEYYSTKKNLDKNIIEIKNSSQYKDELYVTIKVYHYGKVFTIFGITKYHDELMNKYNGKSIENI